MKKQLETSGWIMYRENVVSKVQYFTSKAYPTLEIWVYLKTNSFLLFKDDKEVGHFEAKLLFEKINYYKGN